MMKHVQKQFYSLIRTKAGLAIVLVGLFWSFNTIVALLTLTGSGRKYDSQIYVLGWNIGISWGGSPVHKRTKNTRRNIDESM